MPGQAHTPAATATDPGNVIHLLSGRQDTFCGQDTTSEWSQTATPLQELGIALFCDGCFGDPS